ncbi:MAG: alpha/beta hydrolase [Minisyncoccia bacterium]
MKEYFFEPRGIYYRTNSFQPDRQTIVLIHGLSGHASAWKPYEEFLDKNYNILTFDLRGHGKSRKYASYDAYKISLFADDLLQLLNYLKIEKFTLVTHSFGCLIALEFVKNHQDMIEKLILMSPSFSVDRLLARIIKPFLYASRVLELLPFRGGVGYHFDYAPYKNARDWNLGMTFSDIRLTGLRAYLFSSLQTFDVAYDDLLSKIEVPTLLIHGRKDSIFPIKNSMIMKERISDAELVILEEGDHIIVVNTSYFGRIKSAVEDFMLK